MIPAKEIDGELWVKAADARIKEAVELRLQMDLRDYFAAKAIQGLMSNYKYDSNWEAIQFFDTAYDMAEMAYVLADEMMKAREQ